MGTQGVSFVERVPIFQSVHYRRFHYILYQFTALQCSLEDAPHTRAVGTVGVPCADSHLVADENEEDAENDKHCTCSTCDNTSYSTHRQTSCQSGGLRGSLRCGLRGGPRGSLRGGLRGSQFFSNLKRVKE